MANEAGMMDFIPFRDYTFVKAKRSNVHTDHFAPELEVSVSILSAHRTIPEPAVTRFVGALE